MSGWRGEISHGISLKQTEPRFWWKQPHGHVSTPVTDDVSGEGWTPLNFQMSPKKVLRAAMLKTRFDDTIFWATHQSLWDHGEKSDPARMQQEKERMERQQREGG
ncbi:uncharacterized protein [Henckelia pumila]|uniref:uncharacterized protein n=1 Tax=Henckelia pumila TaxID=405737 RepID=UPI003C6DD164